MLRLGLRTITGTHVDESVDEMSSALSPPWNKGTMRTVVIIYMNYRGEKEITA